jgi:hypothetical protein
VTSKNCWQQEALPSVTKLSKIGVINSGKGILVKSGRAEGNGVLHYLWRAVDQGGVLFFLYFHQLFERNKQKFLRSHNLRS